MQREARRKLLLLKQTQPLLLTAGVVATSGLMLIALMVLWSGSYPSLRLEGSALHGIGAFRKCIIMDESHYDDRYFDANACISVAERSQRITALVKTLAKALNDEDIDYWLDSGTLLGQFRTQSVISWDTDADIGITMDGYQFLRDNILQFSTSLYELQVYESEVNPGPDRDWNIPVRFVETKRGFYVDVFVFSESTANDIPMLGTAASCSWIKCVKCLQITEHFKLLLIPRHYVFPLIPCKFADFEVLCPARRTLYLEHIYGVDFRIADPSY